MGMTNNITRKPTVFVSSTCYDLNSVRKEIKDFFEKQNLLKQCPITVLYESTIQHKKTLKQVRQQMKKDQVTIEKLYGRRGILEEKEYEKIKELKCS